MVAGAPSPTDDLAASYRISLVRTGEGSDATWVAEVAELPNCSARGSTPEEAVRRVWRTAEEILGETPAASPQHSGKLLVRMPATLHDELARVAESEGVSLNQLITGALAAAVEWRKSDEPATNAVAGDFWHSRVTRIALAANFAVVLLAAAIAIALLVVAWRVGF